MTRGRASERETETQAQRQREAERDRERQRETERDLHKRGLWRAPATPATSDAIATTKRDVCHIADFDTERERQAGREGGREGGGRDRRREGASKSESGSERERETICVPEARLLCSVDRVGGRHSAHPRFVLRVETLLPKPSAHPRLVARTERSESGRAGERQEGDGERDGEREHLIPRRGLTSHLQPIKGTVRALAVCLYVCLSLSHAHTLRPSPCASLSLRLRRLRSSQGRRQPPCIRHRSSTARRPFLDSHSD